MDGSTVANVLDNTRSTDAPGEENSRQHREREGFIASANTLGRLVGTVGVGFRRAIGTV